MTSPTHESPSAPLHTPTARPGGEPSGTPARPASWLSKIGWLVLIWGGSVSALGLVSLALRRFMQAAGLTP
ncbi:MULTISPECIES: DUF2474 domain-containing protein [Cobetia]|uniref:DUF2474 domain-containing protein n=1 Tax=Cobetia TaxID=204286 RepID=UPI000468C673|nr:MULTISPECIES: DUF2474 domain-containing protein [Cobetia]MBR9754266.1 DUF2474 domain-containing protein [Gammaproteobacteria bacterium]MBR9799130.1 DUF2474 domain-containing protein [Gammaproteobacteria bacterium]TCJ26500.1 DUF2474 domain-containing protein [Halomonas sp. GDM18]WOI24972.1 DUF2474 domain-containing protein [Cobetia amphilecti]